MLSNLHPFDRFHAIETQAVKILYCASRKSLAKFHRLPRPRNSALLNSDYLVVIPVYDNVRLLDVSIPLELFGRVQRTSMGQRVKVLTTALTDSVTADGGLTITVHSRWPELDAPHAVWIPGGTVQGVERQLENAAFRRMILSFALDTTIYATLGEGTLLLAATGLLDGWKATTHWAFHPALKHFRHVLSNMTGVRYVLDEHEDRYRISGSNSSAGFDVALEIIRLIAGQEESEKIRLMTMLSNPPLLRDAGPPDSLAWHASTPD